MLKFYLARIDKIMRTSENRNKIKQDCEGQGRAVLESPSFSFDFFCLKN